MRIISGSARGKNLKSPRGTKIRPTPEKVKAAFFNILHDRIHMACFLDLFSGSGGMGLEALSRGAKYCVFVDRDKDSISLIKENLELTKMQGKARVLQGDVHRMLKALKEKVSPFQVIYIDPPYKYMRIAEILCLLHEGGLVDKKGIIGVERESRDDCGWLEISPFSLRQKKSYGDTALFILDSGE